MPFIDRHPHLRAKHRIQRRNIDARKMAGAVAFQRFENEIFRDRLREYGLGLEITDFIAPATWQTDFLAHARRWAHGSSSGARWR